MITRISLAAVTVLALILGGCATAASNRTAARERPHAGVSVRGGAAVPASGLVEEGGRLIPSTNVVERRPTPAELMDQRREEARTMPGPSYAPPPIFYGTVPPPAP